MIQREPQFAPASNHQQHDLSLARRFAESQLETCTSYFLNRPLSLSCLCNVKGIRPKPKARPSPATSNLYPICCCDRSCCLQSNAGSSIQLSRNGLSSTCKSSCGCRGGRVKWSTFLGCLQLSVPAFWLSCVRSLFRQGFPPLTGARVRCTPLKVGSGAVAGI